MYKKGDFCDYLSCFRIEKGCEFTHTSIVKPSGAFYVPCDAEEEFLRRYKLAMAHGEELYMTERHRTVGPVVIDLDFRFESEGNITRKYTQEHVDEIVKAYSKVIREYVACEEEPLKFCVMEKPYAVMDGANKCLKDGIHIIVPNIVTKPSVQYLIRQDVMPRIEDILKPMGLKNPISDVVDEAVIQRNNWQMYGSKKPNCEAYKVTRIVIASEDGRLEDAALDSDDCQYVEILSIRNKYEESTVKIEKAEQVKLFEERQQQKTKKMSDARLNKVNDKKNTCDNLEFVEKLIDVLDGRRAETFESWIRVGWCLRNIDHRLLHKWIDFSRKSSKFMEGECEKLWNVMREDGLGIGSLHMWAKQDNKEAYDKMIEKDLFSLISNSSTKTHHDIAKVVHFLYKYEFACASIKHNYWFEFKNHRWVTCDSANTLRIRLSTEVVKKYLSASAFYSNKASNEDDADERDRFTDKSKRLLEIANKLKDCPFKENILKECRDLFYIERFEEKLDSKCHLLGFENGVYDLEANEFREGRPEDYISFSTGVSFIEYEADHPYMKDVQGFLAKVFRKPDIRDYVMKVLSSFMNGNIREERFHIWTGVGANGKSKITELYESALGDYCCKFPITLLTQKRAASNAATSELARAKGKRFACLQEPSEDEKLNIGLMKELTGGDKIMARALFKEPIEFKPQFKMILTCNHLPNVPSDDGGTWRRIRVVEFTSRFKESPDPNNPDEFKADTDLSSKFADWKEHFMALLIRYYRLYKEEGVFEPEDVLQCTKEYQRNNDNCLEFIEQEVEKDERSFISVNDLYAKFGYWSKDNAPHFKPNKKVFSTAMSKTLNNKPVKLGKTAGWKGYRFKQEAMLNPDDDALDN